jgi:tRNA (uracil-5-)-methyltransferase TRM9
MHPEVVQKLLELNQEFYQTFGKAFAATRQRIQPGVLRVLESLPKTGDWLDLGCGSGSVAAAWAATPGRQGKYVGLDASTALLEEAEKVVSGVSSEGIDIRFLKADLAARNLPAILGSLKFDVVVAFAVLHHLPGYSIRRQALENVHKLLKPGGQFIHSVWQFQHSPRLMSRRLPWKTIQLTPEQVESGDTLIDWRYTFPSQLEQVGLRYVHLFNREELHTLAESSGFTIEKTFESDGEGGRLGLYQVWQLKK